MNRGEIWTAAGGVYASKPRPVLVMQDDRFGATESVVVVPMITHVVDAPLTRVPIEADALSGIAHNSFAMVDKITTVRRTNLGEHIGRASAAQLVEVERSLLVFFAYRRVAGSSARGQRHVRMLATGTLQGMLARRYLSGRGYGRPARRPNHARIRARRAIRLSRRAASFLQATACMNPAEQSHRTDFGEALPQDGDLVVRQGGDYGVSAVMESHQLFTVFPS